MKKLVFLLTMLFALVVTTYAQSNLNETAKNVVNAATTVNQTVQTVNGIVDGQQVNQETSTTVTKTEIPDSTALTSAKVYSDFKAGLIGIAKALKTTVEHVYRILCIQQVVKSITWVVTDIVLFILFFLSIKYLGEQDWDGFNIFIICVVGCVFIAVLLTSLKTVVTGFVNPEYGAIKDIIEFISPTTNACK